ncbi:response regulator [Paradevosia shaoguanensis]|jgi:two-component system OmpR family response regulator|uniref:response regulator n=1 Tax=Paradevosia shaoguanensis TaxID=1335043 RepID=UPI000455C454|nr:response regulator transcription factor [Paradevosia shaoguanensis]KFL26966.1 transcriptional regulator [Devosia sp. 17-2-E-8]MBI4045663.1 response regulator transcription factor [Devosia nanyangense]QMV02666.1 response regulator [Devosia sp. D6-9]CDP49898.1 Tricarboxylate transport transcriptional regulator TctD [Devosia sp. DBB001]
MRILVVEDNLTLAEGLSAVLKGNGYAVDSVHDGVSAEAALRTQTYDLAVLDLNLPEMDGLELLRRLRARQGNTAVLILTARGAFEDRVKGLDLGADDYMTKPFDVSELEARIRVLLRRQAGLRGAQVSFGQVVLDLNSRTASSEGRPLDIPARELSVLETLMLRAGKVVAKEAIIQSLSAFDDDLSANAVEQYASRLRKRLAPFGLTVRTARGLGYYLDRLGAEG